MVVSLGVATACATTAGCAIGPDYRRPDAAVADAWLEAIPTRFTSEPARVDPAWWKVFGDPILEQLVDAAVGGNRSLRSAAARVVEALARRGIAVGTLFPQQQEGFGAYQRAKLSEKRANQAFANHSFSDWQFGFDAFWELDLWGRLRRNVEAADAAVQASVATYDDVLVTLLAEMVRNYLLLRTSQEQLAVARANLDLQQRSFEIADLKFQRGAVSRLDALQASALLEDTRSRIPELESRIRQIQTTICVLLGRPPEHLGELLGGTEKIPSPPATVALGIPADLLRRRPDVRRAERLLAAQSAQIGIAKADYLPRLALSGTLSLAGEDFADLFKSGGFEGFGGPSFRWAILNYGRIANNVRVQDALYQALIGEYENTVLRAQAEVEASIAAFLGAERQLTDVARSVDSATMAVEIADMQYREGAVDYTRVLNTQEFLVAEQNRLVTTRSAVALNLTALYKALGGGWETHATDAAVDYARERSGGTFR